ncbi:hypothetical protein MalM25_13970 [Planctomycetes bacterium MalM25]|nr:hypothetical protein MalM25_13970 [Planctomycetes bacterium MalM25]
MGVRRSLFRALLVFSVALAPCAARAESATAARPLAVDVVLQPEGLLVGQVVSASGAPLSKSEVKLRLKDGREAVAKTNEEGGFAFRGVRGVVTLHSDKTAAVVRTWAPGTAPPNATPALLMVEGDQVARGQHYAGAGTQAVVDRSKRLMANPLFVAGVIATAVAIPVAIANDDDDPAS